jgi:hypothetical protein
LNSLPIHPNKISITSPKSIVNKLGDFKFSRYSLDCKDSQLNISKLSVGIEDKIVKVDLMMEFSKDFSVDLLQKLANYNKEGLMSLIV